MLFSPYFCLQRLDPNFVRLMLLLTPISFQVQELIINKDPTLLDNFLDVRENRNGPG